MGRKVESQRYDMAEFWLSTKKVESSSKEKKKSFSGSQSFVQIVNKNVHWNSEPKIRTRSPGTIHPSRTSMSNVQVGLSHSYHSNKPSVQIFDEKLNWDAQSKVHCWSEIDLRQLTKKKSIFAVK